MSEFRVTHDNKDKLQVLDGKNGKTILLIQDRKTYISVSSDDKESFCIHPGDKVQRKSTDNGNTNYTIERASGKPSIERCLKNEFTEHFEGYLDKHCNRQGHENFPRWTMQAK